MLYVSLIKNEKKKKKNNNNNSVKFYDRRDGLQNAKKHLSFENITVGLLQLN
jgi:hypothetical protein